MSTIVPDSHTYLLTEGYPGIFTSINNFGHLESSVVQIEYDNSVIYVNINVDNQKYKEINDNTRVALIIPDPEDSNIFLSLYGHAAEIDKHVVRLPKGQNQCKIKILIKRVMFDAIHK